MINFSKFDTEYWTISIIINILMNIPTVYTTKTVGHIPGMAHG